MAQVLAAYNSELAHAEQRIRDAVARASAQLAARRSTSFLGIKEVAAEDTSAFNVKVKTHAVADPDASVKQKIDLMEHKRSKQEKDRLTEQAKEMKALTDIVVRELENRLQADVGLCFGASFFCRCSSVFAFVVVFQGMRWARAVLSCSFQRKPTFAFGHQKSRSLLFLPWCKKCNYAGMRASSR
jgi:hypothetical protein